MTLILSYANPHFVVQVADRKLTNLETGDMVSLNTNKTVLFCHRMAFGFTGIAKIADGKGGLVATDMWLANMLHSLPRDSSSHTAIYAIRDKAAAAVAATKVSRRSHLRLAFCGVGWVSAKAENEFSPTICEISNFHTDYSWQTLDEPRNEFSVRRTTFEPEIQSVISTGAELTHSQTWKLRRALIKCGNRTRGPAPIIRTMVDFVQEIASQKSGVGKDILATMIPRGTAGLNAVALVNEQTGAALVPFALCEHALAKAMLPQNRMQFRFFQESSRSSVEYGPTMVWPGRYLCTDFETGTY